MSEEFRDTGMDKIHRTSSTSLVWNLTAEERKDVLSAVKQKQANLAVKRRAMKKFAESLGAEVDWGREVATWDMALLIDMRQYLQNGGTYTHEQAYNFIVYTHWLHSQDDFLLKLQRELRE